MKNSSGLFVAVFAAAFTAAGCSMDTQPTQAPPSQDVREYYLPLEKPNVKYNFTVQSNAKYYPADGQLVMDMQGASASDMYDNKPVYICNWSYPGFSSAQAWYYAVDKDEAVGLGIELNNTYTDTWVDLKAPLDLNKSWTFTSEGETVTATVENYGATAKVRGVTYNDVMMVHYKGDKGTDGVEWFSKGKGLIYNHLVRPNFGYVHNELESIVE
jgi:hypothetical protein